MQHTVLLEGDCAAVVVQVTATIPVGGRGAVFVPTYSAGAASITEGGALVWNGAYVPGVPGIVEASATVGGVNVFAGSGTYVFQATV